MNLADRVKDTSSSTGTGAFVLSGSAPSGFRTLSAIGTVGATFGYVIDGGAEWEVGTGTITAANTFSRSPSASSNAGALVNFSAGTKTVFHTATASILSRGLVDPDDVGYDIIGYMGQSNAEGRGLIDSLIDLPDPRVWQFGSDSRDARYRTVFAGNDPNHNIYFAGWSGNGVNTGNMSMMTVACKVYAGTRPAHRKVLYVPLAVGGTVLVATTAPWAVGNALYVAAVAQANAAIAAAVALYPNSRYVGTLWHQGEGDAGNSITQAAYTNGLTAFIAGLRSSITGAANSWFVIGGMVPEATSLYGANWTSIDSAHKAVALAVDRCMYVAGPSGYTPDNLHYNAAGSRIIGTRMGLAIRAASQYVAPVVPASAVTLTRSAASGVVGTPVTITVGVDHALTGSQTESVTLSSDVAGAFSVNPVALSAGTQTASSVFTPSAVGAATITGTATGTPTLANGTIGYTSLAAATVPAAPTIGVAVAGDGYIDVAFTRNSDGGAAVIDSTATLSTGQTATGATSPIRVTAPNGTAATATVKDRNSVGLSAASAASNSVTPAAAVASFATWNPADKHANLTLSNGNKTVTGGTANSDNWFAVRSTVSKTAGKWYWEITSGGGVTIIGVANAAQSLAGYPGQAVPGLGWHNDPSGVFPVNTGTPVGYGVGDVLGFALNMDARTLTMYKNGAQISGASYAISGTDAIFAMLGSRERGATAYSHVANFGASAFAYTPPAGHVGLQ